VIVVDASALSAFILKEPGWEALSKYLTHSTSVDHVVKEVSNAIWKAYKVRNLIGKDIAIKLYKILKSMINTNVILEPEEVFMDKAFEIALETGLTVYDSLYVALALERKLPLLTLDERQGKVAKEMGIEVVMPHQP